MDFHKFIHYNKSPTIMPKKTSIIDTTIVYHFSNCVANQNIVE